MRKTSALLFLVASTLGCGLAACGSSQATDNSAAPPVSTTLPDEIDNIYPPATNDDPSSTPPTTAPAPTPVYTEGDTFKAALAGWNYEVAHSQTGKVVSPPYPGTPEDPYLVMSGGIDSSGAIPWPGSAAAPAETLTNDLGDFGGAPHQQSIKIAADFNALGVALGVPVGPIGTIPDPPPGVVVTITGTGPASDVTLDISNQETQHTQVPLPYTYTQEAGGTVSVEAQDGSGAAGATITCTITESGSQVATNTSTGPYAVVTCTD
jgi:hypothetical protein